MSRAGLLLGKSVQYQCTTFEKGALCMSWQAIGHLESGAPTRVSGIVTCNLFLTVSTVLPFLVGMLPGCRSDVTALCQLNHGGKLEKQFRHALRPSLVEALLACVDLSFWLCVAFESPPSSEAHACQGSTLGC